MIKHSKFDYSKNRGSPEVSLRLELLRERLKYLSKKSHARILDVGVGSGDITLMLLKHFKDITCVEYNMKNCSYAIERLNESNLRRIKFIYSKIEGVKFSKDAFNHIILQNMLEHLKDPVKVLRKLSLCLDSNGYMHISVPLANSFHRWLGVDMGLISRINGLSKTDIRYGHYRVYTPALLRKHIGLAGLRITYEKSFYLKPFPSSVLSGMPLGIHRALFSLGEQFPEFAAYIYLELRKP